MAETDHVLVLAWKGCEGCFEKKMVGRKRGLWKRRILDKADDFVQISKCKDYMLEFFEMMVVVQLLSLEISVRLGNDVDMPRNLAKSVTVE